MTTTLRDLPARQIVRCIAHAAERWSNADFPPRVRVTDALEQRLGYSIPVIDFAFDRLVGSLSANALEAAIVSELGSLDALDGIASRAGAPASWARGVERAVVLSSDSTIGVALVPALFALCAKCDVTVKDRSDALVGAFFETLAQEHPAFADAARALTWTGGDGSDDALIAHADVVVAFGRDDTLLAVRAKCGPATRFIGFGHRASLGWLSRAGRAQLDDARAELMLRDALLYDGEGCLSLHALFIEGNRDDVASVADMLRGACERVAVEFPAGKIAAPRTAAAAAFRNLATFRAAAGAGVVTRTSDATLVFDAPLDVPPPFVARTLPIFAVASEDDIAAYVETHALTVQAIGTDVVDERAIALAARIGAVRVCPFGEMQDPPAAGHHGGQPRIADFIRWIDAR